MGSPDAAGRLPRFLSAEHACGCGMARHVQRAGREEPGFWLDWLGGRRKWRRGQQAPACCAQAASALAMHSAQHFFCLAGWPSPRAPRLTSCSPAPPRRPCSAHQVLNIPTKINKGSVEITADVHLIKTGDKVSRASRGCRAASGAWHSWGTPFLGVRAEGPRCEGALWQSLTTRTGLCSCRSRQQLKPCASQVGTG